MIQGRDFLIVDAFLENRPLDAQSATWMVAQWAPQDAWSDSDKQAFLEYQGEATLRKDSWGKPKKP